MTVNRVTLAGLAGHAPRTNSTHNGKSVTKLSIATTRQYQDAAGTWQEKTQLSTAGAYGSTADGAAKIQTGDHLFFEGKLVYREYSEWSKPRQVR